MKTRELGPLLATSREPFSAHEETYSFGSPIGRVAGAVLMAALGLFFPALLLLGHGKWLPAMLFWAFPLILSALGYLVRPYEVHISQAGLVRFTSLVGRSDIITADIVRIVRYVRPGNGTLDHFTVVHSRGSTTLHTDREEIFERLRALNPSSQVSAEVYDPD